MTPSPTPIGLSLRERAARVWTLLPIWTLREVRVQYRQSAIDIGWSLLTPIITLIGYGFVLTIAFGVEGPDDIPYVTFAWTGLVVWTFVSNGMLRGTSSLVAASDLIRKAPFPKEVIPIATVLCAGLDLGIGLVVLAVLMVIQGVGLSVNAIAVLPVLVSVLIWTAGCAVLFGALTTFLRDVAHALAVVMRVGVFVTPVMYSVDEFPEKYQWALQANPIAVYIEAVRASLLYHQWPDWRLLAIHTVFAIALLLIALWYLRHVEGHIADAI